MEALKSDCENDGYLQRQRQRIHSVLTRILAIGFASKHFIDMLKCLSKNVGVFTSFT